MRLFCWSGLIAALVGPTIADCFAQSGAQASYELPYYQVSSANRPQFASDEVPLPPSAQFEVGSGIYTGAVESYASPYARAIEALPHDHETVAGGRHRCDEGDLGCYPVGHGPCCKWYGSVRGLIMTRDRDKDLGLSCDLGDVTATPLSARDAAMDWTGGVEARIGRYFHCGQSAIELIYWGLYPDDEVANAWAADTVGGLSHRFSYGQVGYDSGDGNGWQFLNDWFGNAQMQRLRRGFEFHNVEINLLHNPCMFAYGCAPCGDAHGCCGAPRLRVGMLAGVRWIRLQEDLQFASDDEDTEWTGDPNELFHEIDMKNDLVGFQIGGDAEYHVSCRCSLTADVKFGLFGNHVRHRTWIGGSNGSATIDWPGTPYDGAAYDVNSDKTDVSFVGEINLGGRYQISKRCSASLGYRAVALTGLGLATSQWPVNFEDLADVADIESNNSMILHGAYAGVEFNY